MGRKKTNRSKKKPEGMRRDAFLKILVEIINEDYDLPFKFVKRGCDRDNQNEIPKNITI